MRVLIDEYIKTLVNLEAAKASSHRVKKLLCEKIQREVTLKHQDDRFSVGNFDGFLYKVNVDLTGGIVYPTTFKIELIILAESECMTSYERKRLARTKEFIDKHGWLPMPHSNTKWLIGIEKRYYLHVDDYFKFGLHLRLRQ